MIDQIVAGTVLRELQDPAQVTRVRKLSKPDGRIDWMQPAEQIARHVRGMQPWPGPCTELHQPDKPSLRLQILSVEVVSDESRERTAPGVIASVTDKQIIVSCGSGEIAIVSLQPDGKRPMSAAEFLRGRRVVIGDRFE